MRILSCDRCGSNELKRENDNYICLFCGTKYKLEINDFQIKSSNISLGNDIELLLDKCLTDPQNAKRYANLILDIDPFNKEALKFL